MILKISTFFLLISYHFFFHFFSGLELFLKFLPVMDFISSISNFYYIFFSNVFILCNVCIRDRVVIKNVYFSYFIPHNNQDLSSCGKLQ